ncbi:MAG: hypothetical protein JJ974_04080, partial [Phycisphaerales bacterium]|nr:hypothetical protein [Phycisphaerales bacterium]
GTGMVIAAMYLLYMVGKICFGPLREPEDHHDHESLPTDLSRREIGTLIPLAAGCLVFGLQPTLLLDAVSEPVNTIVVQATTETGTTQQAQHAMISDHTIHTDPSTEHTP